MASSLPPTYQPVSPSCLADKLRDIADLLESRSPSILSAEHHYESGIRGEPVMVIQIRLREDTE